MDYRAANVTDMNLIPINHRDVVKQGDKCYLVSENVWCTLGSDGRTWLREPTVLAIQRVTSDVALSTDASTAALAVTLSGLEPSSKYLMTLGCRVYIYTDADHAVGGAVDIVIGVSVSTDASSVATCTLSGTPAPDVSNLPSALSGATATVAASTGGFTISATRKSSTACHARAKWFTDGLEKV